MAAVAESAILQPGVKIKVECTEEQAKDFALKLYGITTKEICELNSYDDKNYLIRADKNVKNPHLKTFCPDGYVLKILNSFDSKKTAFVEGQTALSLYLNDQKIVCPKQLPNVDGKHYSLEGENVVRLYEFIPGKLLFDVPPSPNLFYHAGLYLGKLDESLKNFHHDGYNNHKTLWMLDSVANLEQYVYCVNEAQRGMVEDIIQQFRTRVLANSDQFPKQQIHGDFNEQNILVGKKEGKADYSVIGFIDFGDTQQNSLLFELAIALCYMLLTTGDISTGGYFLAGYKMTRLVPEDEMKVLRLCVCARLCQSLVLGLYFHQSDSGNDYLLTTQKAGWRLLEELYSRSDADVNASWNAVADEYLTQSYK